jgi:hypothetical protein
VLHSNGGAYGKCVRKSSRAADVNFGEPRVAHYWRRLLSYKSDSLQLSINTAYKDRQLLLHFTHHKVAWHSPFRLRRALSVSLSKFTILASPTLSIINLSTVYMRTFSNVLIKIIYNLFTVGRDGSVCIAIRYRLEGPEIEFQWGRNFPHPSTPTLGPTQPPVQLVPDFFPGDKVTRAWCWPSTPI